MRFRIHYYPETVITTMSYLLVFPLFLFFWILFSGLFDLWHFGLGLISCGLVLYLCRPLMPDKWKIRDFIIPLRFLRYLPWLMYQIILANIYMVKVVLHPRMRDVIFPHVVKFNTRLKGDLSITTFANSITLTPGTITIKVEDNVFYVHAIDEKVAASLPGDMERKVGQIFKGA